MSHVAEVPRLSLLADNKCKKTKFIKTVIGDIAAHLKPQNSQFCQICNVLFHHYSASSILLSTQ